MTGSGAELTINGSSMSFCGLGLLICMLSEGYAGLVQRAKNFDIL